MPLLAQHRHTSQPRRLGPHSRETGTPLKVLAAHMPPPEHQVRQLMYVCIAQNIKAKRSPLKQRETAIRMLYRKSLELLLGDKGNEHAIASVQFQVLRHSAALADKDEAQTITASLSYWRISASIRRRTGSSPIIARPSPPPRLTHSHAAYPALLPPPSTTVLYVLLDMVVVKLARPTRGALPALKMRFEAVPRRNVEVFSVGARPGISLHLN